MVHRHVERHCCMLIATMPLHVQVPLGMSVAEAFTVATGCMQNWIDFAILFAIQMINAFLGW